MCDYLLMNHQVHRFQHRLGGKRRKAGLLVSDSYIWSKTPLIRSAVSRWDRMLVFGGCNLAALACFVICFALFPVLSLRPRKFAIL